MSDFKLKFGFGDLVFMFDFCVQNPVVTEDFYWIYSILMNTNRIHYFSWGLKINQHPTSTLHGAAQNCLRICMYVLKNVLRMGHEDVLYGIVFGWWILHLFPWETCTTTQYINKMEWTKKFLPAYKNWIFNGLTQLNTEQCTVEMGNGIPFSVIPHTAIPYAIYRLYENRPEAAGWH